MRDTGWGITKFWRMRGIIEQFKKYTPLWLIWRMYVASGGVI